ncbi:MAG: hypothetical protein GX793_03375 [Bacteroidales bacterium]|jgi:hypothetical protein|nr:DUF3352 domain-containing protein [Bacteroidales bacterium]MDY0313872.1 DUF3352 domain-containing protein [Bacteroidales bacterium]NLB86085.1 hypothetical protein [Bacteroidales bacterium]
MKKRVLIISITSVLAGVLLFLILFFIKSTEKVSKLLDAIPGNPALIIETNSFNSFIESLSADYIISSEIQEVFQISSSNSLVHCFDSLSKTDFFKKIKNKKSLFLIDNSLSNLSQALYIEIDEKIKSKQFQTKLNNEFQSFSKINEREYKSTKINECNLQNGIKFFYSIKNHILIISNSAVIVEKSIDVLESNTSICKRDEEFSDLYASAGKNELANIYINLAQISSILKQNLAEEFASKYIHIENFANWIEMDLNTSIDKFVMNGFIENKDSLASLSKLVKTQNSCSLSCLNILPDNSSYYTILAFTNYESYNTELSTYLKAIGKFDKREESIAAIKENYNIDIKDFYELIVNEICVSAIIENNKQDFYTILELKSQSAGMFDLESIIQNYANKNNKNINDFQSALKLDEHIDLVCYKLPVDNLPSLLFGPIFTESKSNYVCFIKNFMVFAETKEALIRFAKNSFLNKTMDTNIEHKKFLENFSDKSLLLTYFSLAEAYPLLKDYLSLSLQSLAENKFDKLQKFKFWGYQINKADDKLYNNMVLQYVDNVFEKAKTVWESRIEYPVNSKPFIVTNHDDNSKEILVQDENNNLYLINNIGREIWKIKLEESIFGDVHQIDAFNNGKLQYLFSTNANIYLIDKLGNNVANFPIKLRSKASSPLSVFDYENNNDYRIIIACEDKKLYLYDVAGKIIKGWNFNDTENQVNTEISHYIVDNKDYIVFHDDFKFYSLNRRGEARETYFTNFKFSKNNKVYLDKNKARTRFVCTDDKGNIRYFSPQGQQDSLFVKEFGKNHYFVVADIDSDGNSDYIFADSSKLYAYNCNKKLLFSLNFNDEISFKPIIYKFSNNQTKIGIVCRESGRIYLIHENGNIYEGFPLIGRSLFSIGYFNDEKMSLIVGGLENLLYNYKINEN